MLLELKDVRSEYIQIFNIHIKRKKLIPLARNRILGQKSLGRWTTWVLLETSNSSVIISKAKLYSFKLR